MAEQKIPVAVFVFNRPNHANALFQSLAACSGAQDCQIHIYCDGPSASTQMCALDQTRQVANRWATRLKATVTRRESNLGLARSIVKGVSQLCDEYGHVIVLEDDLVLHPRFLEFMVAALRRYQHHSAVFQISGFSFPLEECPAAPPYFLPLTTSWGWATWRRAWQCFQWQPADAEQFLIDPAVRWRFDLDGVYPYSQMLEAALHSRIDSWAVRWQFAVFRAGGNVLYPPKSLVWNAGFDDSGIHGRAEGGHWQRSLSAFQRQELTSFAGLLPPDGQIEINQAQFHRLKAFIASSKLSRQPGLWSRLSRRFRRILTGKPIGRHIHAN